VGHPNEKDFLEKWEDHPRRAGKAHIRDRRWVVYINRDFRRPAELLEARLEGLNLGKHLSQEVKESRRILDIEGLASDFKDQMSEFLDDRFPWER
jgi:tRNA nucleotidyltransferase (CCA-adding enzyme)